MVGQKWKVTLIVKAMLQSFSPIIQILNVFKSYEMKSLLSALLFFTLTLSGFSQENVLDELHFEVNKVLPYVNVNVDQLNNAKNLIDLDKNYKEKWIREYISVEILTINNGKIKKAISKNDVLSEEQKTNMQKADAGTEIGVYVRYMPENNLSQNKVQLIDFKFVTNALYDASYLGGERKMIQYLKENVIDKIPRGTYQGYDIAAVNFTVNEEGEISELEIFDTTGYGISKNEKIDNLLLETIRKMPCWKPAEYADGTKTAQKFVLTVGNHENCIIPLLSIREY